MAKNETAFKRFYASMLTQTKVKDYHMTTTNHLITFNK